jgi:hypothetical protein
MRRPGATIRDAAALFALALAVRAAARWATGFDGLYGQDPFAYLDYAARLRDALAGAHLPPPFFWPIGYPLLVAAAMALLGGGPAGGQAVSLLAGATVAPAVYLLVREADARARVGAWAAGAVAAVGSQLLLSSLSLMSDACGLAWVVLSALAMARYLRRCEPGWLAASAFALGCAVLTRWVYALAVVPWAVSAVLAWRAGAIGPRRIVRAAVLAVAVGGAVVGAQFLGGSAGAAPSHVGDLQVVGWNPANAVRAEVANSDGRFHYRYPIGVFYALPALHPAFVFPLLSPFLLLGAFALRVVPRPLAALLALWPVTVWAFLAGIAWENPRFSLALLPPLLVLVGLGVERALGAGAPAQRRAVVLGVCAISLAGMIAWSSRDLRRFVAAKDETVAVSRWAEASLPRGAVVLTFGLTDTVSHYTGLSAVELYNETAATLPARACGGAPAYLLLDVGDVATQWEGLAPHVNFLWLRDHAGLAEIGRRDRYTLWRVGDRCRGAAPPPPASGP